MRVLVIGGSGHVGTMVLPHLAAEHTLTVLDRRPPRADLPETAYREGDLTDHRLLAEALAGQDALLFMAMGPASGWGSPENTAAHLDVAVKGLHLALDAAAAAGVGHTVFTSSMSVYAGRLGEPMPAEDVPPDARDHYGLAKRLGEEVLRARCAEHGMTGVALRLCFPIAEWPPPPETPSFARGIATSGRDTARAMLAALAHRPDGVEVFAVSGDAEHRLVDTSKAAEVLGWQPLDRV